MPDEFTLTISPLPGWGARMIRISIRIRSWLGRLSDEEKGIKSLMWLMWKAWDIIVKHRRKPVNLRYYTLMVFKLVKECEAQGIKFKLPYFWYTQGVQIEWNELNEMFNKVGWQVRKDAK